MPKRRGAPNTLVSRSKRSADSSTHSRISADDLLARHLHSAPGRLPSSFTSMNPDVDPAADDDYDEEAPTSSFMTSLIQSGFLKDYHESTSATAAAISAAASYAAASSSLSAASAFAADGDGAVTEEEMQFITEGPDRMLKQLARWYTVAPRIVTELKNYQHAGVDRLISMIERDNGALLADEVGLGKTIQSLGVICACIEKNMRAFEARADPHCLDNAMLASSVYSHTPFDEHPVHMQLHDLRKPFARARVRGEPTLVVVPLSALAEWIKQVVTHTVGLTLAVIDSDKLLLAYVTPDGRRSATTPVKVNGTFDVETLRAYDILVISYKKLHHGCTLSSMTACFTGFKLFDNENRHLCRAQLHQVVREQSKRANGSLYQDVFDMWCRPKLPVGQLLEGEPLGRRALWSIKPTLLVCDEAHIMNNPSAQITREILTICASGYLFVSASPSNNHLLEFATLLVLMRVPMTISSGEWRTLARCQKAQMSGDAEAAHLDTDPMIVSLKTRFSNMLAAHMMARLGREVGVYNHFKVHRYVLKHPFAGARERQINSRVLSAAKSSLERMLPGQQQQQQQQAPAVISSVTRMGGDTDGEVVQTRRAVNLHFQALITRGKQVATAAASIPWRTIIPDTQFGAELEQAPDLGRDSTKLRLVKALLADTRRIKLTEKVIITSFFIRVLRLLSEELTAQGIKHVLIVGEDSNASERMEMATQFQTDGNTRVCLISLRIASSITLSKANHVIFTDPWVSPTLEEQAAGRVMRLCQTNSDIYLWYLVISGSIEEHVHSMAMRKKEESAKYMHGNVDKTRLASRADMMNLHQLREFIAQWTSTNVDTAVPQPIQASQVQDEWANEHSVEPLVLSEGTLPYYDISALINAAFAMIDRAAPQPAAAASASAASAAAASSSSSATTASSTTGSEVYDEMLLLDDEEVLSTGSITHKTTKHSNQTPIPPPRLDDDDDSNNDEELDDDD